MSSSLFSPSRFPLFLPLVLLLTLCLVGASASSLGASSDGAEVFQFRNERQRIVIVHPDPPVIHWDRALRIPITPESHKLPAGLIQAVRYLRDGIEKMTGEVVEVEFGVESSEGIVLALSSQVSQELGKRAEVQQALGLRADAAYPLYEANEAYYVKSSPERLLILANEPDGLMHGVVAALESVGYEVLGMGPGWTVVPRLAEGDSLAFSIDQSGRPGFFIRHLWATSGQSYGVGTLSSRVPLNDPADEHVEVSYQRWRVGMRLAGQSMPSYPGHALHKYHGAVLEMMAAQRLSRGFLVERIEHGPLASRPVRPEVETLWFDEEGKAALWDGERWREPRSGIIRASLDLSVPEVRELIFEAMKNDAKRHFEATPEKLFIFATDPEDGGAYHRGKAFMVKPDWYPALFWKDEQPAPYRLHQFRGIDQPLESWDPTAMSDHIFGFNNWLLRSFDQWIDTLPAEEQVTSGGLPLKERIRCSLYSYNFHDVPPSFNLDSRIRVMVAGFPKHRGRGKWRSFKTHEDIAEAYQLLLPSEPPADYQIYSLAYILDFPLEGIGAGPSISTVHQNIYQKYAVGFRALSVEIDFNFGKMGLAYYLYAKMLWNPTLSLSELESLRDQWLQRSFGSGWEEMKAYYELLASNPQVVNAPNAWAKAIRLIDAAGQKAAGAGEHDAVRRIDDFKTYWLYYYLVSSGEAEKKGPLMQELLWKGQMSYINPMHMIAKRYFGESGAGNYTDILGAKIASGPARFSHEETAVWWKEILEHWKLIEVDSFVESRLANSKPASEVDLYDLVPVSEFLSSGDQVQDVNLLRMNAGTQRSYRPSHFLTTAAKSGDPIGFVLFWPAKESRAYQAADVPWGLSAWDRERREWQLLEDETLVYQSSVETEFPDGQKYHVVTVQRVAPSAGTYRFSFGRAGNGATVCGLDFEPDTAVSLGEQGQTYDMIAEVLSQPGLWFYIPKGTRSLDLEVWDRHGVRTVQLHEGLPGHGSLHPTRKVEIGARGTHRIELEAGEDGSLVRVTGNGAVMPYLYSVPLLWARTPHALLVPRAIAEADGLTPTF